MRRINYQKQTRQCSNPGAGEEDQADIIAAPRRVSGAERPDAQGRPGCRDVPILRATVSARIALWRTPKKKVLITGVAAPSRAGAATGGKWDEGFRI